MTVVDISALPQARPRHYGRWIGATVLLVALAYIAWAFAVGNIDWPTVGEYLFHPRVLWGVVMTIVLSVIAMVLGVIIGTVTAIGRTSHNPVISTAAAFYTWLFRGAPILLQLLIWYNLALIFPVIGIPGLWHAPTVVVMTPFAAALIAFSLHCPSMSASTRPRSRSAWATDSPSAALCCRRRCGWSFRRWATSSSGC